MTERHVVAGHEVELSVGVGGARAVVDRDPGRQVDPLVVGIDDGARPGMKVT